MFNVHKILDGKLEEKSSFETRRHSGDN